MPSKRQIARLPGLDALKGVAPYQIRNTYNVAVSYRGHGAEDFTGGTPPAILGSWSNMIEARAANPSMEQIYIKKWVEQLRKWMGINQTRFGRIVGVSQHQVSKWETESGILPSRANFDKLLWLFEDTYYNRLSPEARQ